MKKFQRYIEQNWFWILIGLWLASEALDAANEFRGKKAVGSEFLVLPVFLIIIEMLKKFLKIIKEG